MIHLYAADVGDGLSLTLRTRARRNIQLDCGSMNQPGIAFDGWIRSVGKLGPPSAFILSHFHEDHYNGLGYGSLQSTWAGSLPIEVVYYPGIPKFPRNADFYSALFAMNARLMGDETGLMAYDFLLLLDKLSSRRFSQRALFAGERVRHRGSLFQVLWPPHTLTEKKPLADVRRAIEDFEAALGEDPVLVSLHKRVREEQFFGRLKRRDRLPRNTRDVSSGADVDTILKPSRKGQLPASTKKANKSLRKAANHLSLALFEDESLVFFGDAEKSEISRIVDDLSLHSRTRFRFLIAPHHGTHWHAKLNVLRCEYSVSSLGRKLSGKLAPGYKEISRKPLATFANGDIALV